MFSPSNFATGGKNKNKYLPLEICAYLRIFRKKYSLPSKVLLILKTKKFLEKKLPPPPLIFFFKICWPSNQIGMTLHIKWYHAKMRVHQILWSSHQFVIKLTYIYTCLACTEWLGHVTPKWLDSQCRPTMCSLSADIKSHDLSSTFSLNS